MSEDRLAKYERFAVQAEATGNADTEIGSDSSGERAESAVDLGAKYAQFEVRASDRPVETESSEEEDRPGFENFYGRNLNLGLAGSLAGLDRLAANTLDLVGIDSGAEALRERAAEIDAEAARRIRPEDDTIGAKVLRGTGAAPITVLSALPAIKAAGPVGGLAALGALRNSDQGLGETIKGATLGAAEGALIPLTAGLSLIPRAATAAGGSGALELAAGGSVEDATASAILGGVLAPLDSPRARRSTATADASSRAADGPRPELVDASLPDAPRPGADTATTEAGAATPGVQTNAIAPAEVPSGPPLSLKTAALEGETPRSIEVGSEVGSPLVELIRKSDTDPDAQARGQAFLDKADRFGDPELSLPDAEIAVNLDRIQGPDDLKAAVQEISGLYQPQLKDARRGTLTFEEQRKLSDELGIDVETVLSRRKGQALNAEELRAFRKINNTVTQKALDAAKKIRSGGATDTDKTEFFRLFSIAEATQAQLLGARAEVARALGSLRDPIGVGDSINFGKTFKALRGLDPGADPAAALADMIADLDSPAGVSKFLREAKQASTSDVLLELYVNSLLSGPKTQIVNAVSNALTVAQGVVENYGAAALGAFRGGSDRVTLGEANARVFGTVQGFRDGLNLAAKVFFRREVDPGKLDILEGAIQGAARRLRESESRTRSGLGQLLGTVEPILTTPTRALTSADAFFKEIAKRQELNARAFRSATERGLNGQERAGFIADFLQNPPKEAQVAARRFAEKATFQQPLGPVAGSFSRAVQNAPVLRLIFPFVRTPTNVFKYAIERTPAGLLMKDVRTDLRGQNGKASRDLAVAKMVLSTGAATALAALTSDGTLTGAGPTDPELRRTWFDAGYRPYSIRIGDEYYSYARFEPIGTLLGVAADFNEISAQLEAESSEKAGGLIVNAFMRNLGSKTFLQGLTNLSNALSDPDRYADRFVQQMAGSIAVPTLVADIERNQDPTLREVRTIVDQIRSRLPGYSSTLPARINVWGGSRLARPRRRAGHGLAALLLEDPAGQDPERGRTSASSALSASEEARGCGADRA